MDEEPESHPTSIPQEVQKGPATTRNNLRERCLQRLIFGRLFLVSGTRR